MKKAFDSVHRGACRHMAPSTACKDARHIPARAFTLIELLTVVAIIGLLAMMTAPALVHVTKPDVTVSAPRQMLDDCARARQLAISTRSTVFMVFVPANFWGRYSPTINNTSPWLQLPPATRTSSVVTQLYAAQLNGYFIESMRNVGDQPGRENPQDLMRVKTLPAGSFIAPAKFTAPAYPSSAAPHPYNRTDLPVYGFLSTNDIPFPTAEVLNDMNYASMFHNLGGLTLPYIAFNSLGQLTFGDGSVLPYDENIPLAFGTFAPARDPLTKIPIQAAPAAVETPSGNSMSMSYNVIHIDHLTGRARLERLESL